MKTLVFLSILLCLVTLTACSLPTATMSTEENTLETVETEQVTTETVTMKLRHRKRPASHIHCRYRSIPML